MFSQVLPRRLAFSSITPRFAQSSLGWRALSSSSSRSQADIDAVSDVLSPVPQGDSSMFPKTSTLRIGGLPSTVLHDDVWRLLDASQIQQATKVELVYHKLFGVGAACVTFKSPEAMNIAHRHIRKNRLQFCGKSLMVAPASSVAVDDSRKDFGKEAALAGPDGGSRLDAGIWERGRSVVIWGTPGKLSSTRLASWLAKQGPFKLANKRRTIVKLDEIDTLTSRFIIFAESIPEAHALVRKVHRTLFDQGDKFAKADPNHFYTVNARVIS